MVFGTKWYSFIFLSHEPDILLLVYFDIIA